MVLFLHVDNAMQHGGHFLTQEISQQIIQKVSDRSTVPKLEKSSAVHSGNTVLIEYAPFNAAEVKVNKKSRSEVKNATMLRNLTCRSLLNRLDQMNSGLTRHVASGLLDQDVKRRNKSEKNAKDNKSSHGAKTPETNVKWYDKSLRDKLFNEWKGKSGEDWKDYFNTGEPKYKGKSRSHNCPRKYIMQPNMHSLKSFLKSF